MIVAGFEYLQNSAVPKNTLLTMCRVVDDGGGKRRRLIMNRALRLLVLVLAIIGAIAVLAVLAMWLMHLSMMRGDMMAPGAGP